MTEITVDLAEWLSSDPVVVASWRAVAREAGLVHLVPGIEARHRRRGESGKERGTNSTGGNAMQRMFTAVETGCRAKESHLIV